MTCCSRQCQGVADFFDDTIARRELRKYRKRGPRKTTRLLLRGIRERAALGGVLLDIGGGVGAIQHELVPEVMAQGVSVDAAPAYLATAKQEAEEQGYAQRMTYVQGNFVEVADTLEMADVVTLDRVICCFDEVDALVQRSAQQAQHLYALVYPRTHWLNRLTFSLLNVLSRLQRSDFRIFLHASHRVETLLADAGFQRCSLQRTLLWQVRIYERTT